MKDLSVVFIVSVITIATALIIINACNQAEKTFRAFVANGYEQQQRIGTTGYIWVKYNKQSLTNSK